MTALIDRATEEAAIAAFIAARGVTQLPEVDPVERALEIWRAQREDGGTQTTFVRLHKKRGRPKKIRNPERAVVADPEPSASEGVDPMMAQEGEGETAARPRGPGGGPLDETGVRIKPEAGGNPAPYIATLAYALWEMEGRTHGADVRHWLTAEAITCGHYREIEQKAGG